MNSHQRKIERRIGDRSGGASPPSSPQADVETTHWYQSKLLAVCGTTALIFFGFWLANRDLSWLPIIVWLCAVIATFKFLSYFGRFRPPLRIGIGIVICIICGFALYGLQLSMKPPATQIKTIVAGTRGCGNESSSVSMEKPEYSGFREMPSDIFSLSLGKSLTIQLPVSVARKGGAIPFMVDGFVPVFVCADDENNLFFTFQAYAGQGEPPIEVKDNEFSVRPASLDRNFSPNALEVVDGKGDPVFQMIRIKPDHIEINGIFPTPRGSVFYVSEQGQESTDGTPPTWFKLNPIFKYPSWKYPGQFRN